MAFDKNDDYEDWNKTQSWPFAGIWERAEQADGFIEEQGPEQAGQIARNELDSGRHMPKELRQAVLDLLDGGWTVS